MSLNRNEFPLSKQPKKWKIIKTFALYIGFIVLGTAFSVVGPSLLDLQMITDTTTETISFVFTARAALGLFGAALNGFVIERINPWVIMAVEMGLCSAAYLAVPFSRHIAIMIAMFGVAGFGGAAYDGTGSMTLLYIWGEDHGSWMQALHAIFGAGAWVGPLIAKPFLYEIPQEEEEMTDMVTTTADVVIQGDSGLKQLVNSTAQYVMKKESFRTTTPIPEGTTSIVYAYLIVCVLFIFSALMFSLFYIIGKRVICLSWTEDEEETEKFKPLKKSYLYTLGSLVFFFYVSYCILEMNYGNFLLVYAVKHLHWTKSRSATLTSVYWGSFAAGRVTGIFMIRWIKPHVILIIDVLMCIISLLPMILFAKDYLFVPWLSTCTFGFFMSTIYATGITWTERYIPVTGQIGSVFMLAGACGELVGPVIISLLFKGLGAYSFMYVMLLASILVAILLGAMLIVGWRHGERYFNDTPQLEIKESENRIKVEEMPMIKPTIPSQKNGVNVVESHNENSVLQTKDDGFKENINV